jgi:uncharacterized membrane protein
MITFMVVRVPPVLDYMMIALLLLLMRYSMVTMPRFLHMARFNFHTAILVGFVFMLSPSLEHVFFNLDMHIEFVLF